MDAEGFFSEQLLTGWLLILSFVVFAVGGMLYTGRAIWKWPSAQSQRFLYWERGFVMAAIVVVTAGLVLLSRLLDAAGERILSPLGMTVFFIGAVVGIVAETLSLNQVKGNYTFIVVFIVLAFVGQAVLGLSIVRAGFLPGWTGWFTTIWNLGWLVILPIFRPANIYYPWLHFFAPLIIGITLLLG
jgi:hypothetical protein